MRTSAALLACVVLVHAGELHDAARVCDGSRLQKLLAGKPPLNERDEDGLTPLHIAVNAGKVDCVGLLLEAGADRTVRDRQGRIPLDLAAKVAEPQARQTISFYLTGASSQNVPGNPDKSAPMPWTLEYSVKRRQIQVTKVLLSMGIDPNTPGSEGTVPLADAALNGDIESVRALLARGALFSTVSPAGTQPIHDAALGDNAEVIQQLVKQGADVNARTREEAQTPLHIAAALGKMKSVEALIALGADRTIKDAQGRTPLDAAERAGLTEVVALLKRTPAPK